MPAQVAIIFGRFNPPHKGHKLAWETAAGISPDAWWVGTNPSTIDVDNPLPFEVKIKAMEAIYPEIEGHVITESTWWSMASHIFKHYGGVPGRVLPFDLIVVTDEAYVVPGLQKQNGVHGQPHGEYHFREIKSAFGSPLEAKEKLRISSATDLRNAVAAGDKLAFEKAAGVPADTPVAGHKFFDLVAHYLLPHREAQAAKDRAKAEKEAAKQKAAQEKEHMKAQKAAEKSAKVKGPAQTLAEMPISITNDPNDPDIYGHEKANPMSLKGRIMQARAQLKELATMADSNDLVVWENLCKKAKGGMFMGLEQNLEQIRHGIAELAHARKTGKGVDPRVRKGIDKNIGESSIGQALEEIYEAKSRESLKKFEQDAIPGMTVYDSLNNSDSYSAYRFGIALAPSPDFSDMSKKSALANSFAMIDYTDADAKIRKGAEKSMGVKASSSTSNTSKELTSTNKISPVAAPKRNKYGI